MSEIKKPYVLKQDLQFQDNGQILAAEGVIRYNSTRLTFEGYTNGAWHDIGRKARTSFTISGSGMKWVRIPFTANPSNGPLPMKFTITKADSVVNGNTVGGCVLKFTGTPVDTTTGLNNYTINYKERGAKDVSVTQWVTNVNNLNEGVGVNNLYLLMAAGYTYIITFDTDYGPSRLKTDGTYAYAPTDFFPSANYPTTNAIKIGMNNYMPAYGVTMPAGDSSKAYATTEFVNSASAGAATQDDAFVYSLIM